MRGLWGRSQSMRGLWGWSQSMRTACGDLFGDRVYMIIRCAMLRGAGAAHLDFFPAMQAEHCVRAGSSDKFETINYRISSTPSREWKVRELERARGLSLEGQDRVSSAPSREWKVRSSVSLPTVLSQQLLYGRWWSTASPPPWVGVGGCARARAGVFGCV